MSGAPLPSAVAATVSSADATVDARAARTVRPRLLVTRPQPQADEWVAALQALGLDAVALPLLAIAGPGDTGAVHAAWQRLAQPGALAVVMFVSPGAVGRFFALRPPVQAWPAGVIAAAPGPGTGQALRGAGVPEAALLTPPVDGGRFDSEALWAVLEARCDWPRSEALIVRGEQGRDWLADAMRRAGATVHFVEAYRRTAPVLSDAGRAALQAALAAPAAHCWLFSSSEAAGHLPALAPGADWSAARALATHPRIAEAARSLGFGRVGLVAPSPQAVADALAAGAP